MGSRRYLDVMDVTSQRNIQMTMKEFSKYWSTPPESRTQLLNVISLEFSNTKLDPQVLFNNLDPYNNSLALEFEAQIFVCLRYFSD